MLDSPPKKISPEFPNSIEKQPPAKLDMYLVTIGVEIVGSKLKSMLKYEFVLAITHMIFELSTKMP